MVPVYLYICLEIDTDLLLITSCKYLGTINATIYTSLPENDLSDKENEDENRNHSSGNPHRA